ncbi:MAG: hypothetical protein AB8E82_09895 [Aureispira sp.]
MKKIGCLTSLFVIISILIWLSSTGGLYRKNYSPDRQFSVSAAAYNYEMFVFRSPGDGGSASGKVFLYDEIEQKTIASGEISSVGLTGDVRWSKQKAYYIGDYMPSFALPRPIRLDSVVEYPNERYKKYTPFGVLLHEWQFKEINGIRYRVYDIYYNREGEKQLEYHTQFFPDSTKEKEIWQVQTYKSYSQQKLYHETHQQGFTSRFRQDSMYQCGIHYNYSTVEPSIDTFPPCYQ